MSNRRTVENYLTLFQNLVTFSKTFRATDRQALNSNFVNLERVAGNFSLDHLEKLIIAFISQKNLSKKNERLLLLEEVIWYNEENPYQLIKTAFRVRSLTLTKLSQSLKLLAEGIEEISNEYLNSSYNVVLTLLLIITFLIAAIIFYGGQQIICQETCQLNDKIILVLISAVLAPIFTLIVAITFFLVGAGLAVLFDKIELKNRHKIKLPELRLLFVEMEKIKLNPMITIKLDESKIFIRLEIKPDVLFLHSLGENSQ
jgi:hypothetical protein